MPEETARKQPAAEDPWLRAALQRPAGPEAAPEEAAEEAPGEASEREPETSPAEPVAETPAPAPVDAEPAEAPYANPRSVRRLAVQALYILGTEPDAPAEAAVEKLLEALDEPFDDEDEPDGHAEQTDAAKEAAVALALAAWADHAAADAAVVAQVPAWPTLRQPPVDRAILRLAHHELVTQRAPFAVVINEAVDLAKAFGEERTPGFVNAVLDALARGASPKAAADGDATGPVRRGAKPPPAGAAEARRGHRERFNQRKAEMAAKVGPKRDPQELREERERQAAEAEARRAEPPAERERERDASPDPAAPADPWSAAAARRDD